MLFVGGLIGRVLPSLQMKLAALDSGLTHDEELNAKYREDPLCAPIGTYRGWVRTHAYWHRALDYVLTVLEQLA